MKIPRTTKGKPYIEFRVYPNGKIKLSATSSWWGGKNNSFISSDGSVGNSCKDKNELNEYITHFIDKRIKGFKDDIADLQQKINTWGLIKSQFPNQNKSN